MNAFEVYLLFSADKIGLFLVLFGAVLFLFGVMGCLGIVCDDWNNDRTVTLVKRLIVATVMCWVVAVLMPSSKTLAAMWVLPKLTSPETVALISTEASEVYALAKRALTDIAKDGASKHE